MDGDIINYISFTNLLFLLNILKDKLKLNNNCFMEIYVLDLRWRCRTIRFNKYWLIRFPIRLNGDRWWNIIYRNNTQIR